MSTSSTGQAGRFSDLPNAWAIQLMTRLSSKELQSFFSTSKACRNMVLRCAPNSTLKLSLLEKQSSMAVMLGSLRLASQQSSSVSLCLGHGTDRCKPENLKGLSADAYDFFINIASAFLWTACGMQLTAAVTKLELQDARLDSPLPLAVSEACPNLIRLKLYRARLDWDRAAATSFSGSFPKLQTLILEQGHWVGKGKQWRVPFQQQAAQLTSLRSLTLTENTGCKDGWQAISYGVPAEQLTHLAVSVQSAGSLQHVPLASSCHLFQPAQAVRMVRLQHLVLDDTTVGDTEMQMLLSLPSLNHLEVSGFSLQSSFADHPVRWKELAFYDITVGQLTKLPLGNADLQLVCKDNVEDSGYWEPVYITSYLEQPLSSVNEALANINRCKGLKWESTVCVAALQWEEVEPHMKEHLLEKVLLLAAGVSTLRLDNIDLNHANTQTICKFLSNNPGCMRLELAEYCTWCILACAAVMNCMPINSTLDICSASVADVTKLCCLAEKPITLVVTSNVYVTEEIKQHVRTAMRMCGHQHVRLLW